ncbi:hypothetical protein GCM10008986_10510 [Salinibacillus aidingensis]|uniref:Divergent PAP2 family protein n=1 Tax=Salinibacillus aidingensis TaxID=237684 RepID=A0ABP3KYP1_9BACI
MPYFLAPFAGWLASGSLKFLIHYFKFGKDARQHTGNGGFPSTHTATVSSTAFLIGLGEGFLSPVFGLAVTVLFIVILDATGLRIAVGKQAFIINRLHSDDSGKKLRERMGHSLTEIIGGLVVGLLVSLILYYVFQWWGWM